MEADEFAQAETWMKPLVKGQETGLVEIPASWYIDDLPPMMFIKKAAVSWQSAFQSIDMLKFDVELTWMGQSKGRHGPLEGPFRL